MTFDLYKFTGGPAPDVQPVDLFRAVMRSGTTFLDPDSGRTYRLCIAKEAIAPMSFIEIFPGSDGLGGDAYMPELGDDRESSVLGFCQAEKEVPEGFFFWAIVKGPTPPLKLGAK